MRAAPSQEDVRRHNLGALLRYVHVHGPVSRAELTSQLGLNRSTIGALTTDLSGAGLVSEQAPGPPARPGGGGAHPTAQPPARTPRHGSRRDTGRAGRPSLVVRPESHRVFAYALSIEVDRLTAARVGLGGVVLDRREAALPPADLPHRAGDGAELVTPLAAFVADMHTHAPDGGLCVGAGVAVRGLVPRHEPLGPRLAPVLPGGRPVAVGNAADLAARAEHARGVAAGCPNVIFLFGDAGVGAGIIAGGRPVTGHGGYGGQVGHMVVNPAGRPCGCGSAGCWETEIGDAALLLAAGRTGQAGRAAVLAVIDAANRGDARAQQGVRQVGEWLGFGVANLVNIFNPEMVIFGGTLRNVYLSAAAQVRSRLNSMALPGCREHVRLRTPALGEDAALIGAADLAFEQLLTNPLADPPTGQHSPTGPGPESSPGVRAPDAAGS